MFSIPKVILHEHLEGSVTANLAVHLSRKNGIVIPDEYIRRCAVLVIMIMRGINQTLHTL